MESRDKPESPERLRSKAWTQYWRSGVLHSLPGTIDLEADGPPRQFWSKILSALGTRDRVLDVGSGNGPIARLLLDLHGYAACPLVHAVDLADVAPSWVGDLADPLNKLTFHSRTRAESLPFEDAYFSIVTSQYGFEYSERSRAVVEIARVLQSNGRVALLMHDSTSHLVEVARAETASIDWLLADGGFLDCAAPVYQAAARAAAGNGLTGDGAVKRTFDRALADLREHAASASASAAVLAETHNHVLRLLQMSLSQRSSADATTLHYELRTQLQHARLRSAELCEAAVDADQLDVLIEQLVGLRFSIRSTAPLHHQNGAMLGRTLVATKVDA